MTKPLIGSHRQCVSSVPIFNHLKPDYMNEVMQVVQHHSFEKGELIYRAEDMSDALYIVSGGKIKIYHLTETGKEQIIRMLKPGDFTGELTLFREAISEHGVYAEALISSSICMIQRNDLQELLLKHPSISLKILAEFSNRLKTSEKQTTSFATEETDTRIALFLARLLEQDGYNTKNATIDLPMSRKDLASYLGTTPETLSRQLTNFETKKIIKQDNNRTITILDLDELLLV